MPVKLVLQDIERVNPVTIAGLQVALFLPSPDGIFILIKFYSHVPMIETNCTANVSARDHAEPFAKLQLTAFIPNLEDSGSSASFDVVVLESHPVVPTVVDPFLKIDRLNLNREVTVDLNLGYVAKG
jgi:hypothetical protein